MVGDAEGAELVGDSLNGGIGYGSGFGIGAPDNEFGGVEGFCI